MHARDERNDSGDEAHGRDRLGLDAETRTRPLGSTAAMLKQRGLGVAVYQLKPGSDHFKTLDTARADNMPIGWKFPRLLLAEQPMRSSAACSD
jgi:hypothetical protein